MTDSSLQFFFPLAGKILTEKNTINPIPYPPRGLIYFKQIWEAGGERIWFKKDDGIIHHKKTRMQSGKAQEQQVGALGGYAAKDQKQIRTSSTWIKCPGSVCTKFYSGDWLIQSIIY